MLVILVSMEFTGMILTDCRPSIPSRMLQKGGRTVATGAAVGRPKDASDSGRRSGLLAWVPWAAAEVHCCVV